MFVVIEFDQIRYCLALIFRNIVAFCNLKSERACETRWWPCRIVCRIEPFRPTISVGPVEEIAPDARGIIGDIGVGGLVAVRTSYQSCDKIRCSFVDSPVEKFPRRENCDWAVPRLLNMCELMNDLCR